MILKVTKLLKQIVQNKTKFIFRPPRPYKYLIFDKVGSENFNDALSLNDTSILNARFESLNLYIIGKCFLNLDLSLLNYYTNYIQCVNPKLVLTFIDNRIIFYQLKKNLENKNIKFISVQNGLRRIKNDWGKYLPLYNDLYSDYYFVWGNNIAQELSKYINTKFIPIGSFKNNKIPIKKYKKKRHINFISQFRLNKFWDSYGEEYFIESKILSKIHDYCIKNDFILNILCTTNSEKEKVFFSKYLTNKKNLIFSERKNTYDNYQKLDEASLNIFVDSTMGYESISRGNKTLAFSLRLSNQDDFRFAWPNYQKYKNKIYVVNQEDINFIHNKIDQILGLENNEWEKEVKYFNQIMKFDYDNTIFKDEIKKLL
tara:strand:+ start:2091 stop:3203 length:1113 start_codon:yes stop_codon:yes gene_type:complete